MRSLDIKPVRRTWGRVERIGSREVGRGGSGGWWMDIRVGGGYWYQYIYYISKYLNIFVIFRERY